jgi:hypothetical protein
VKGLRTYIMSIRVRYTILCFARQNNKSLHEAAIETDSLSSGRNSNGEFKYISFVPVIVKSFFVFFFFCFFFLSLLVIKRIGGI